MNILNLSVKIYADGADLESIRRLNDNPLIQGFTTNPTLMRRAGVTDYVKFAEEAMAIVQDSPISFEVFSDDFREMYRQAMDIHRWGERVYVKIPITNTKGESSVDLIRALAVKGVKVNVTAVVSLGQFRKAASAVLPEVPSVISVFAGRVADTGLDPYPLMLQAKKILAIDGLKECELLWASVREPLNIHQAGLCGCDIITVPEDILNKAVKMCGRDLEEVSLETVHMFYHDALASGYTL